MAFSGTIGKNLINMEFPHTEEEGGTQNFLLKLRDSELKDDGLIEEFYDRVIANFDYAENYYIILIHCAYDIPAKATDGSEMFDASDYVYEFIQCTICPVKLPKAGLCYNSHYQCVIENRIRDWLVEAPVTSFLFPAFNDRNTDIHSLLLYAKNGEQLPDTLIDEVLATISCLQKPERETFQTIVEETLGEKLRLVTIKASMKIC